jgi:excisionase family DNA binding protein
MMIETPKLYLSPREAAKALGICERTLWTLTQQGKIPCVRFNRAVRYSVDMLRELGRSKGGHEVE